MPAERAPVRDRRRYRAIGYSRRVRLPVAEHPTNPIRFTTTKHFIRFVRVDAAPARGAAATDAAPQGLSPAPAEVPNAHEYRAIGYSRRVQLPAAAEGRKNNIRFFTTKHYIRFYKANAAQDIPPKEENVKKEEEEEEMLDEETGMTHLQSVFWKKWVSESSDSDLA